MKVKRSGEVASPNQDAVNKKILADNVRGIMCKCGAHPYTVNGNEIQNGEQLYDYGESEFIVELLDVIDDASKLKEGELGNSDSQSASP